jgi:hypothetical protein
MTGYTGLFIAIKPSNGGNCAIVAVMGPDAQSFANLKPVNPAATLRGTIATAPSSLSSALNDSSESCAANVWNIFHIADVLKDQKLLQFQITNNSGDISTVETAFMRLV